jgi:hypothetical protein
MYDVLTGLNPDPDSLVNKAGWLAVSRVAHVGCTREAGRAQNTDKGKHGLRQRVCCKYYALDTYWRGIKDADARALRQAALTLGFGDPTAERRCATRLQHVKEIWPCGHHSLCITPALLSQNCITSHCDEV